MLDNMEIINRIVDEHKRIGKNIKLLGDSVTDEEALVSLEKALAEWIPGRPGEHSEKHGNLQQMVGYLSEGLRNHFDYEEKVLPPLVGELIMSAISLQHQDIYSEIELLEALLPGNMFEDLTRDERLKEESRINQKIGIIRHLIEEHAGREEVVLGMLQQGLERGR